MNTIDEQTIRLLQRLIQVCKGSEKRFEIAASGAESDDLGLLLLGYALERAEYVRELRAQIFALGGDGKKTGGWAGALSREWMNLKSVFTASEPQVVVADCERAEGVVEAAYRAALVGGLDPESRKIVARQALGVRAAHERIKQLRDSVVFAT